MTGSNSHHRNLPFLHRNWIKVTNHWNTKMGNKASSPSRDAGDNETRDQRPAKRRRVVDTKYDGFPLYEAHGDTPRALRIEILKICHKDAPRVKNGILNGVIAPNIRDTSQFKVRLKLTVSCNRGDERVVLHVDSQLCDVNMYKNPAGSSPMARFSSVKPFHIPEDKICLEREDDSVFGLASSYQVLIELESAGGSNWPPGDLLPPDGSNANSWADRKLSLRQWVFSASIADIFNPRNRKTIRLKVKRYAQRDEFTDFLMDVDVRWLTAISARLVMGQLEKDIMPSITVFDPNEPVMPLVNGVLSVANGINGVNGIHAANGVSGANGVNGHLQDLPQDYLSANGDAQKLNGFNGSLADQADDLAEGELTPGRARRQRPEINYNLKKMMATALGRTTGKRRRSSDDEICPAQEQTVTYVLPPEQVQVDRLACLLCGAENERISQLRAHYQSHPDYEFNFDPRARNGVCVAVTPVSSRIPLRPAVYQLGLPVKPLDLDKYVEGDLSFVTSRLGPENPPEEKAEKVPTFRVPRKPRAKQVRKKVLVPNIRQPLFDPLSKVQLIPGSEVPQRPMEDSWLLLKHRQSLVDFTDVEPGEKEYMLEWDWFILKRHISSVVFLHRAFLAFVKEKASWIVANEGRSQEFGKHVSMLLSIRGIDEKAVMAATKIINEARTKPVEPPSEPPKKRAAAGCAACGDPVAVPSMLICANKACEHRLYHDTCVANKDEAVAKGRNWVCGKCS
ncbi:hypothetical protein B0H63DRAFT_392829 [Podospora didyma]|uniref:Polycomb protein VEFS-Box domain-containing protein n=1 Tax=Podospora didyma TaxID=330526 RepID=A0AAE0NSR0_9PEZI|nr:hypothetical protein B0H63DRAFT_392829 [Podospora didyma]